MGIIDESGHPPKIRKIKNVADLTHNAFSTTFVKK
jgi:hypothetical protein